MLNSLIIYVGNDFTFPKYIKNSENITVLPKKIEYHA